ncbi:MAG: response regulator [Pricia sp.]
MTEQVIDLPLVIWIIDDDLVSLFATHYCIDQAESNAKVQDFDAAETALQRYRENLSDERSLPDVIFLDLIMPSMTGWQFLEVLAQISSGHKKTDVYILSAFSNAKDRQQAKAHPAIMGIYDKPLSRIDMERTLLAVNS